MGEEVILGGGVEQALITDIAFWVIALSTIVAALAVVHASLEAVAAPAAGVESDGIIRSTR